MGFLLTPICADLAKVLFESGKTVGAPVTMGGTYVCMEGPLFSTRAESFLYKSWGADVIGMTNLTEAKLAREAEMCYASLALVTDFDCWHEEEDDVTIEAILAVMSKNTKTFRAIIKDAIPRLGGALTCECKDSMKFAIITSPDQIGEQYKKDLDLVLDKYLND